MGTGLNRGQKPDIPPQSQRGLPLGNSFPSRQARHANHLCPLGAWRLVWYGSWYRMVRYRATITPAMSTFPLTPSLSRLARPAVEAMQIHLTSPFQLSATPGVYLTAPRHPAGAACRPECVSHNNFIRVTLLCTFPQPTPLQFAKPVVSFAQAAERMTHLFHSCVIIVTH